jgi:signal transduction histidine kinase
MALLLSVQAHAAGSGVTDDRSGRLGGLAAPSDLFAVGGLAAGVSLTLAWVIVLRSQERRKEAKFAARLAKHRHTEEALLASQQETQDRLETLQRELTEASRHSGMAEVATGVLHNVGNVLNSVNVSASLLLDNIRKSKAGNVAKVAALLREHEDHLSDFVKNDPKGRQLVGYVGQLADMLASEQAFQVKEINGLLGHIEHIKDIVAMQQSYAKVIGVTETVKIADLVEDALRLNSGALVRHEVRLACEFEPDLPEITVEKHKVLQILINLIRNAKYACDESGKSEKLLTVRIARGENQVHIIVADNGVGIAPENLPRIFNHGFTTRRDGHGFGLHSGAVAAQEMGGNLEAHSDGLGQGATFTLTLPLDPYPMSTPGHRGVAA